MEFLKDKRSIYGRYCSTTDTSRHATHTWPGSGNWIPAKLEGLPDDVRQPVMHFATWHHLRRVRAKSVAGEATRGPVHSAKQEITETIKFLVWLHETHDRTAATCTQLDIDEWLTTGPTTRTAIRTFFVVAEKTRLNTSVAVQHRAARTSPSLTQDQRMAWLRELLDGASESLPYRVAGILLLLYAQPLVKVVTLEMSVVNDGTSGMTITLGKQPTEVPRAIRSAPTRPHGQPPQPPHRRRPR